MAPNRGQSWLENFKLVIRRIVQSLKGHHYSTLVIELLVVIFGVFIGIQVSNWNEERIDRSREQSYLERICSDLEADMFNYRDRLRFWKQVSDYGIQGLDYANSGDKKGASDWEILLAFFQSSQLAEFFPSQSTYDELKSSGELGLISDVELRNQLANYYSGANNPLMSERTVYREHIRGVIPIHIQNYMWESCFASDNKGQYLLACASPIEAREAAELVESISANRQLMAELTFWVSTMRVAGIVAENRLLQASQLWDVVNRQVAGGSADNTD